MPSRTLTITELQERLEALSRLAGSQIAIGVDDPEVAKYARVLEYGSLAGQPPWPGAGSRTTVAVDAASGAAVVVSAQAPQGFIRTQAPVFPALAAHELAAAINWLDNEAVQSHIERATQQAAQAALARIQAGVPRDSGRLAASLKVLAL